jgi:hypothetical protein
LGYKTWTPKDWNFYGLCDSCFELWHRNRCASSYKNCDEKMKAYYPYDKADLEKPTFFSCKEWIKNCPYKEEDEKI